MGRLLLYNKINKYILSKLKWPYNSGRFYNSSFRPNKRRHHYHQLCRSKNKFHRSTVTLICVAHRTASSFLSILIKNQTKNRSKFLVNLTFIKFTLVTYNFLSIRSVFDADSEKNVHKIFRGLIVQIYLVSKVMPVNLCTFCFFH